MVTSQKDQIQSLITEIERVLDTEKPRKSWVRASETESQRQALSKAQDYLIALQQSFEAPGGWGPVDPSTGELVDHNAAAGRLASPDQGLDQHPDQRSQVQLPQIDVAAGTTRQTIAEQNKNADNVLQALLTEMKFLKSSALQPLRLEMESLQVERDTLNQEVKALSEQRNQVTLALAQAHESAAQANLAGGTRPEINEQQLNDFLQALMERLQERLSVEVTQTLGQLESEHSAAIARLSAAPGSEALQLQPGYNIEEIRQLQSRSDQLLSNIDLTLQGMFETLQKNIDSYQFSLNEGIENMHSLGRQGEVIVRSLVDHLTQQLGQTAPPEPAFYAPKSAEIADYPDTSVAAIDAANTLGSPEVMSPETDTITSLDEILPEEALGAIAPDANTPNLEDASPEASPEDCIREDGTIDLDLLKLDIERTEEDQSLSRDDLMIDSAIADARVAATEDDSAIEAKVTPTADAEFLADLTLDDFTLDSLQAGETNPTDEPLTTDSAETEAPPASNIVAEVPAPDLAAILPDLGIDEGADETSQTIAEEPTTAAIEETVAEETVAEETVAEETVAEETVAEEPIVEESTVEELTQPDPSPERPESALTPDLPETDSDQNGVDEDPQPTTQAVDATDADTSEQPDDLFTTLEENSAAATQASLALPDRDLDDLTSDLEEAIVFDADIPTVDAIDDMAVPLESALIPDMPDDGTDVPLTDSLEDMLSDLENESALIDEADLDKTTEAEKSQEEDAGNITTEMPPEGFDDDLDFYSNAQTGNLSVLGDADDSVNESQSEVAEDITADPWDAPEDVSDDAVSSDESTPDLVDTLPVAAASAVGAAALINDNDRVNADSEEAEPVDTATQLQSETSLETAEIAEPVEPADNSVATAPPEDADNDPASDKPAAWFLGLDFGATGLSAVVINQLGDQVYPLCWNVAGDPEKNRFRLPAVVQVNTQMEKTPTVGTVGPVALQQQQPVLRNLKLMVKAGIPNGLAGTPWMQWTDQMALPLNDLQAAVSELVATLSADQMSCTAVGLKDSALRRILSSLDGVVVGYPTNWPDTYGFNIREAVVSAGLVDRPEKVFFVEDSVAALLSALPLPSAEGEPAENQQPGLYNCNWTGGTVIISAGATLTEAALVDLPAKPEQLSYSDFALRSYTYAGDGIDQDIVCQLMHVPLQADAVGAPAGSGSDAWASLGLSKLQLPRPGEADRVNRHRLRQRLNDSELGREALAAARELKVALQEENEVDVEVGDRTFTITRKDLEEKIFLPYVQRINRQTNSLLGQKSISAQDIKQVICTGGSASLGTIARWLRQKFPNATIIQDTYTGEYSNSCSRVAYGLANLCHYPNVLDANRHQYNDYFLLMELLRILPDQPLPAGGILHLLEQRGIHTQACQAHVLALIEGHLPPGLVPTAGDRPLISAQSSDIATYQALAELPLFRKQGGQIYIADMQQGERLRTHMEALLATKSQSLSEPMSVNALTEQLVASNVK